VLGAIVLATAAPLDCRAQDVVNIVRPPAPPPPPYAPATSPDPVEQHLRDQALACIRAHAADVERLDERLADAVDFLLDDLCRIEVGNHDRYVSNTALIAQMRNTLSVDYPTLGVSGHVDVAALQAQSMQLMQKQRDAWKDAKVDPQTGALIGPPGATGVSIDEDDGDSSAPAADATQTDSLRAAAAQAVLAARTARLARP
jgi:hypothetical protein